MGPDPSSEYVLELDNVSKFFGTVIALNDVTLRLRRGEVHCLLGDNGAGKSTTLRAISGFLGLDDARVTEGTITFQGTRIENRPPNEIARLGVVLVPERDKVFPNLTVAENLTTPVARRVSRAGCSCTGGVAPPTP